MIGTTVGSYLVTQKISVGGMGTVYKAEHTLIGKLAAVKVLHPELRNNHDVVNRFFNEAKATTQIKHPGIVEIFDFGYLPSGDGYIIMEFLEGVSLARRLTMEPAFSEGEAAMLLRAVCSALAAAHDKKIVHRDLKPDNIFLCPDADSPTGERPKLLDFGIAKLSDASLSGSTSVTKTGSVMGTPTYMSPEQCKGTGEIDRRSDLYSLGCIFYEMMCGRPPFTDMAAGELIGAHLFFPPDPPTKYLAGLSADSEKLILQLLEKKPDARPATARELAQRLAVIAQKKGYVTNTNPAGVVLPSPSPRDARLSSVAEVSPTLPSDSALVDVAAGPPTTLSGAASESVPELAGRRGRGRLLAAAGAGVLVVGLGFGFFAWKGNGGGHDTRPVAQPQPVAQPSPPATATPTPIPTPSPTPSPTPTPIPSPIPSPIPTPTPISQPEPKQQPKPVMKTAAKAKPMPKPQPQPAPKKPDAKPPATQNAGSGSNHILIETDI